MLPQVARIDWGSWSAGFDPAMTSTAARAEVARVAGRCLRRPALCGCEYALHVIVERPSFCDARALLEHHW
jgi:hypothetical protein